MTASKVPQMLHSPRCRCSIIAATMTAKLPRHDPALRQKIESDWAARHPALARSERHLAQGQAQARDDFGHKRNGTVETHAKAASTQQGSCARLYMRGSIDVHQLGAAAEIASAARGISGGLGIRTMSMESRIDGGRQGQGLFYQALGLVRAEWAYSRWRSELEQPGPVLAMVVDDRGLAEVGRAWRARNATVLRWLTNALDLWPGWARAARDEIREEDLRWAEARLA